MKVNMRTIGTVQGAINSLFAIKTSTDDALLKQECQRMMNMLFEKFPNIMPLPEIIFQRELL